MMRTISRATMWFFDASHFDCYLHAPRVFFFFFFGAESFFFVLLLLLFSSAPALRDGEEGSSSRQRRDCNTRERTDRVPCFQTNRWKQ